MAIASVYLVDELVRQMNSLERTRAKMESLLSSGVITRRDVEQVYAGLYMKGITSFEYVIEALFIGLLVGRFTPASAKIICRADFSSDLVARSVVFGGRNYVDWFPYGLRNAIAHPSRYARRKFEEEVIGALPLTGSERSPVGFLRSPFRVAPHQTRYENSVSEMVTLARKLCT